MSVSPSRVVVAFFTAGTLVFLPGVGRSGEAWWEGIDVESLPSANSPIEDVVDGYIDAELEEVGITPAPEAEVTTLLRRVTLDLNSRIPTVAEVDSYLAVESPDQYRNFVEDRLFDPAFERYLAHELNWLLMDGEAGEFKDYLERAIPAGKNWTDIFRESVAGIADGEELAGVDRFLRQRSRDLDKMTNDVSVRFFGVNVSCAQCHDHPYVEDWTMDTYYGMKSFFGRTFDSGGFVGERTYGRVSYKNADNEEVAAKLSFLGGPELGLVDEEPSDDEKKVRKQQLDQLRKEKKAPPRAPNSLRERLVAEGLAPGSEGEAYLARSLVNRLWNQFFGRGLVMPLDQMHGANPPSHPELLVWLARDLVEHDFDIERLVRGLVLSRAYRRSSRWEGEDANRPHSRFFAVTSVRPLNPRQYGVALKISVLDPSSTAVDRSVEELAKQLESVERSGVGLARWFERPQESFHISVDEALLMTNSQEVQDQLLRSGLVNYLAQFESEEERIRVAYRNTLSREPNEEEKQLLKDFLAQRQDRPSEGIRQMVWALLTCSEARFNF